MFYKEIANPFLDDLDVAFTATHFTLQTLEYWARKDDEAADIQLIPYYKILSPIHLLKLPFANDSNTLDKNFYTELLHIMGLEEVKMEGKKLIQRKKCGMNTRFWKIFGLKSPIKAFCTFQMLKIGEFTCRTSRKYGFGTLPNLGKSDFVSQIVGRAIGAVSTRK